MSFSDKRALTDTTLADDQIQPPTSPPVAATAARRLETSRFAVVNSFRRLAAGLTLNAETLTCFNRRIQSEIEATADPEIQLELGQLKLDMNRNFYYLNRGRF